MSANEKVVFISQSGAHSLHIAKALKMFLGDLFQGVSFWVAAEDIERGHSWIVDLMGRLASTVMGVFVLTPTNHDNLWMHFEAGAVAKGDKSRVLPLLDGLEKNQVGLPMNVFQMSLLNKVDMFPLVESINRGLGDPTKPESLRRLYDKLWPDFNEQVQKAPSITVTIEEVPQVDLLKETHAMVRELIDNSIDARMLSPRNTIESLVRGGAGMADARGTFGGLQLTLLRQMEHVPREEKRKLLRHWIAEAKKIEEHYRHIDREERGHDPDVAVGT